jgi:hypothetical protein
MRRPYYPQAQDGPPGFSTDPTDLAPDPVSPSILKSLACQLDEDFADTAIFAVFHLSGHQVIYEWFRPETEVTMLIQFVKALVEVPQSRLRLRGPNGRVLQNVIVPDAKLESFLTNSERTVHFIVD